MFSTTLLLLSLMCVYLCLDTKSYIGEGLKEQSCNSDLSFCTWNNIMPIFQKNKNQWVSVGSCRPTCRISNICVTEGGTRARGLDRASSNFTLKTMVFLKWSRASCRTEGSLPCTRKTGEPIETEPLSNKHTHTHKQTTDSTDGCVPEPDERWPAALREHHRRRSPTSLPESRVTSDLHQWHNNTPKRQWLKTHSLPQTIPAYFQTGCYMSYTFVEPYFVPQDDHAFRQQLVLWEENSNYVWVTEYHLL